MVISWITALIFGAISGFLASIPLGPIGILCIQRTLSLSRTNGFISGMGAGAADTIFATLALFCLTYINSFLEQYNIWIKIVGGLILVIFGYATYQKKVPRENSLLKPNGVSNKNYASNFFSVLILTLTNPAYFLVYTMIFAALGMGGTNSDFISDICLLVGVLSGTNLWWLTLTFLIDKLRSRFTYRGLILLNKISGGAIMFFGVWAIIMIIAQFLPPIWELPNM